MLQLPEDEIEEYREKWGLKGRYPELEIASCLGVNIIAPYLSSEVKELALQIPAKCLRGELFEGKRILRNLIKRFRCELIAERNKTPAEAGAGTDSICITP
jgi:asparagine synthase (glutamine-hydrolysing)